MDLKTIDKPVLEVKPNILNAFFPLFLKNLVIYSVLFLFIYAGYTLMEAFEMPFLPKSPSFIFFEALAIVFATIPLLIKTFILLFTRYKFYNERVVSEFRFITIIKKSAVYRRITSVDVKISIWDRFCNAGDIILHTGDDSTPDLKLEFITHPEQMEKKIYELIKKETGVKHKVAS